MSPLEKLKHVKEFLGFGLEDLAHIVGVAYPQMVQWLRFTAQVKKPRVVEKIELLHAFCESIPQDHGGFFGELCKKRVNATDTVADVFHLAEDLEELRAAYRSIQVDIMALKKRQKENQEKHHAAESERSG